ncbi:hypothetical protein OH787_40715 (plasmid) [Streptomyces sp. NBC_01547]|uniref:hypothetical protein n=1 Tax=Streptomyces sp. NBC_01547 TaxID=2975873 RepID=UPI0038636270
MPVQTVDTFPALISCFVADLAHLLEETTSRTPSATDFITWSSAPATPSPAPASAT